ncbi:MAG: DUF4844 domain-containing protein [Flavobacteriales bacterium]|nr:DUF4844 domain-containing protein [Flavobacteriales bacterium]
MGTPRVLAQLQAYIERRKFAPDAWYDRGLEPSDNELCERLENALNQCAQHLMHAVETGSPRAAMKRILKHALYDLRATELDTEEREMICDEFHRLASIVSVDISGVLNQWMYGPVLGTLLKITKLFRRRPKVLESFSQECSKCHAMMTTQVLGKDPGSVQPAWTIIRCKACNEYDLLRSIEHATACHSEDYFVEERLDRGVHNEEQARTRLEQIRFFRAKR